MSTRDVMPEKEKKAAPRHITVRGARAHNLKNIDVEIPLGKLTAIAGVSGSGKSSLALGTLYAEGLAPLYGGAFHLYAAAYFPGGQS